MLPCTDLRHDDQSKDVAHWPNGGLSGLLGGSILVQNDMVPMVPR